MRKNSSDLPMEVNNSAKTFCIRGISKTLPQLVRDALDALERYFGICDLSTIEAVHLRNIVEQCATDISESWVLYRKGEYSGDIPSVAQEAAWIWLNRVYGIDFSTLYTETFFLGCCSKEFYFWINRTRAESHLL